MSDALEIEAVSAPHKGDFLELPYRLNQGDANWVPPLRLERRMVLKPGGSPYLRRAETAFWVARRAGKAVGRISAQIDPLALKTLPGVGHFGFIAAEDDPAIFRALFDTAGAWLKSRGSGRMMGPFDFSVNEECGVLVEGFDTPPMMMMPHNPRYVGPQIEAAGLTKAQDLFAYAFDYSGVFNTRMQRLIKRAFASGVTVRPMRWKNYAEEVRTLVSVFNDSWCDNWGFVPITDEEIGQLAEQLKPLLAEEWVQFAELNGETVGFIVCLPNLNEAIADLNGSLLPTGWAKLLWRLKVAGVSSARVPLMGVRRQLAGNMLAGMIPFVLIGALEPETQRRKIKTVEVSWMLESNPAMCAIGEAICGKPYKTYRLYEKAL
ncbi:MAG: hypothetical protein WCD42_02000 [Rhizomicrobium sp.]